KNDYFTKSLNFKHAIKDSKPFISYITEESYNDTLIILDRELEVAYSFIYNQFTQVDKTWYECKEKVEKIYKDEAEAHGNDRNKVFELAIQRQISQKERNISEIKQDSKYKRERREELLDKHYVVITEKYRILFKNYY